MSDKNKTYIYKMHDLVWAKMPSYCYWPGRIVEPNTPQIAKLKKSPSQLCIFFFGSNNYAWLEEKNLRPYAEFRDEFMPKGKPKDQFMQAMNDIDSFIENPDNFSALFEPKTPIQKKKSTPKPKQKQDLEADFDSLKSDSSVPSSPSLVKVTQSTSATSTATSTGVGGGGGTPARAASAAVTANTEKTPKTEKVPQTKRKSTRESELFDEDMDLEEEPMVAPPQAKKPRKSSSNVGTSPRNEANSEPRRRSDIAETTKVLKSPRRIDSSLNVFGLIGVGIMGESILQSLLASSHEVVVFNRTHARCEPYADTYQNCTVVETPREVFEQANITFICVSDCDAVKEVICQGENGILAAETSAVDKGVIMLSSIDCETSRDIQVALSVKSIRYLEAQLQGPREQTKEKLIAITAGDHSLYVDSKSCLESFAKDTYFLGEDVEEAIKMNLVLHSIAGVQLAALAEALALADSLGLQLRDILEIIELSNINSDFVVEKGRVVVEEKFREPSTRVDTVSKDLKMVIELGDSLEQPLPLVAASKELFKMAKRMGFADDDSAAVYFASNFNKYCYEYGNYATENGTM